MDSPQPGVVVFNCDCSDRPVRMRTQDSRGDPLVVTCPLCGTTTSHTRQALANRATMHYHQRQAARGESFSDPDLDG